MIGVYWVDEDGKRGEPLLFQVASMRDGKLADLRDYRQRGQALKAAKKVAATSAEPAAS
ncbi:MAG TPA: hypothetical protein VFK76_04715 [Gaiellaceae bacterium]|nr:hypothetical protein [Gaiellaceae bacterium]